MLNYKKLSLGLVAAATLLATPAMAQQVNREPGKLRFNYPNSNYLTGGYGVFSEGARLLLRQPLSARSARRRVRDGAMG